MMTPKASEYQAIWLQQTWKCAIPTKNPHTNHLATELMARDEPMKMTNKFSPKMFLSFENDIYSSEAVFHPNPSQ